MSGGAKGRRGRSLPSESGLEQGEEDTHVGAQPSLGWGGCPRCGGGRVGLESQGRKRNRERVTWAWGYSRVGLINEHIITLSRNHISHCQVKESQIGKGRD